MIHKHLLAREVHTHNGRIYVTGWNDRREVSECIAVVNHTTPVDAARQYELAWSWTYDLFRDETWIVGLAYVECDGEFEPLEFPDEELDPLRITPDEYASVVAEAEAQS
jgi:hypothetical protein